MQGHAAQAIEYAWLFVEGIEDLTAEEEAEAYEAVATTLRMIEKLAAAPRGIVLVNADDDHVYGLGKDAAAACRNANEGYGADLAWEQVGPGEFGTPATLAATWPTRSRCSTGRPRTEISSVLSAISQATGWPAAS